MEILYFGKICDEETFKEKEKRKEPFFVAQYMYEKILCEEFNKSEDIKLEINSIFQTNYFPEEKLIINKINDKYNYLYYINLPYLRELTFFFSTIISIIKWYIKNRKIEEKYLYSSCHFPPVSLAIVLMGKIFGITKIVTFTDLSLFTYSEERIKKMRWYKKIVIKPYKQLVNKLQNSYDAYILFTEAMNKIVNPKNKPYCVIEGIYNGENLNMNDSGEKTHAITHAGTLNREVGIDKILDVFEMLEDQDLELWLIGNGDMTEEIKQKAINNKKIKYFGYMQKIDVFELLKKSKLLINLRDTNDIYTEYSFPSKMFEYMASGTPVLTTEIKGIPKEYYNYVYSIDSNDSIDIRNKINSILESNENYYLGKEAREFILNNKNSQKQTKKIINFLKTLKEK